MQSFLGLCTILGGLAAGVFLYDRYKGLFENRTLHDRYKGRYKLFEDLTQPPQEWFRVQKLTILAGGLGGFIPGLLGFLFGYRGFWIPMVTLGVGATLLSIWLEETRVEGRRPRNVASTMLAVGGMFNLMMNPLLGSLCAVAIIGLGHIETDEVFRQSFAAAIVAVFMTAAGLAWGYWCRDI